MSAQAAVPSQAALDLAKQARNTGLFAALGRDPNGTWLDNPGAILTSGPEAAEFLHGQITNDVTGLAKGAGNFNARATKAGTLVQLFSTHRLPEDYAPGDAVLLLLERPRVAALQADLDKYNFTDAKLEDVSEQLRWFALQGPQAPAVAVAALRASGAENWAAAPEGSSRVLAGDGLPDKTLVICRSLTGDPGYLFALPSNSPDACEAFEMRLAQASKDAGLAVLEGVNVAEVLEILRVEAGQVRIGADVLPMDRVVPETGLEQEVVSYSKGCYLGQEVIARIRTYGSVNQALRGLIFDGANADILAALPAPGTELVLADGKKAGQWASRTYSPTLGAPIAFAFLDRNHRTQNQVLEIPSASGALKARVRMLPFYRAADRKSRAAFLHDRALQLFSNHKDEEAVHLLEEALRLDPAFNEAYEALGVILGRSERFHEAIDIFKRLEEVAPDEPMVHTNLSYFYMRLGDKETAENHKAQATVKKFGQFAGEKAAEAKAAEELVAKKEDAVRKKAMFEEVLEIDAEDPLALFGLGNALLTLEDYAGAERAFAKASETQKDNSPAYLAHGKALEKLGREADAAAVYKKGIEVASKKGDLMPLKDMEHRLLLLGAAKRG